MKRLTILGVLLMAVLVCAAAVSTPKPAQAIMCCDNGGYQTAQYWAKAPTCSEAQTAYRALARPEANDFCGGSTYVCAFTIPPCEDWSAYDSANPWKIDGVATFGCKDVCPIYP
jgi:hypothetical protein